MCSDTPETHKDSMIKQLNIYVYIKVYKYTNACIHEHTHIHSYARTHAHTHQHTHSHTLTNKDAHTPTHTHCKLM